MSAPTWFPVRAENLVRHARGSYYLQAKVGGKKIRRSLRTESLRIAKIRRDAMLENLRAAAIGEPEGIKTLGDALTLVEKRIAATPSHKPRTRAFYKELARGLRESLPCGLAAGAWTKDAAARWWTDYAGARAPEQANKGLSMVRKMTRAINEAGLRYDDPARELVRMSVPKSAVDELPELGRVEEAIQSIRDQKKRVSEESANMVEFFLWSGLRKGELQALTWEDVGKDWLTVREGKSGRRRVPLSAPLRALIERIHYKGAAGPVFFLKTPRIALGAACVRVGIPHLRIHDLRHLFATHAIESGVDVPTVAKWLGHKDGGALAMRTYGHIRDDHSLQSIKKL